MLNTLLSLGHNAIWMAKFCAAVFVLYIGIAFRATPHAPDPEQRKIRYQLFRDLLDLFRRGRNP